MKMNYIPSTTKEKNEIKVSLTNHQNSYNTGQEVTGEVLVTIRKQTRVKNVCIGYHGHGLVKWVEYRNSGRERARTDLALNRKGEETYIDEKQVLFSCGQHESYTTVEPGVYTYPFSYKLPKHISSSFDLQHYIEGYHFPWLSVARVTYWIEVVLHTCLEKDETYQQSITVTQSTNLSEKDKETVQLADREILHYPCFLSCGCGPIIGKLSLDRVAFHPGEEIHMHVDVNNQSWFDVDRIRVHLIMKIICHGKCSTKRHDRTRSERFKLASLRKSQNDTWADETLVIPTKAPPTGLPGCNIIDIQHSVQLKITPSGPSCSFVVKVPIIIGPQPQTVKTSDLDDTTEAQQTEGIDISHLEDVDLES